MQSFQFNESFSEWQIKGLNFNNEQIEVNTKFKGFRSATLDAI